MTRPPLLIVRPEPGAQATATRAAEAGWQVVLSPIFRIEPVAWEPPDPARYHALIVTSANAVRHAGPALQLFASLPVYAVGGATAAALRAAGFSEIRSGQGDAASLLTLAARDGIGHALHLAGMDHRDAEHPAIHLDRQILYCSAPIDRLNPSAEALLSQSDAIVLLHSGRAAAHFAGFCDTLNISRGGIAIAALAPAILDAAGDGWRRTIAADTPDDMALLAAAARLCH